MDHAKIVFPMFSHKTNKSNGLMKLPMLFINIMAYGHGDVRCAHYGLDNFAHDSTYTIGSFAKLLQDLEMPLKSSSWRLFDGS